MLEGRNEQTRGRQIRRRGKQRERLEPGLEVYTSSDMITPVIAGYFPAGLMTVSIGASYSLQTELCWSWIGLTMDLRSHLNIVSLITADCIFLVVSAVVKHVTSIEFFHRCQDLCVQISYSPDELVGFLLFLCSFLVNRPKLLMWCFFCFWGELRISRRCCKADIPWDDSWRFTSERHLISPPIDKILRKTLELIDWSCLVRVSFTSWCFIDAMWNPQLMSRGNIVEPTLE